MRRWPGVAGIVFVALAVASRLVLGSTPDPESRRALQKFTTFYADTSNRDHALAALCLGVIGLFFFAWFLGGLWSKLRQAEGAATAPTIIVAIGGATFFALGALSHLVGNVVGITLHFSHGYRLDPGLALVLNELSTGIFLAAMVAAGAAAAAAGVVILHTRALPVWLAWVGFAIAVLALPLIPPLTFAAAVLLALWTVAISVVLLASPQPEAVGVGVPIA